MAEQNNDYLKKVYDRTGEKYDVGSFDSFLEALKKPEKRKKVYDYLNEKYIMDDFDTFDTKILGLVNKSPQGMNYATQIPVPEPAGPLSNIPEPVNPLTNPGYAFESIRRTGTMPIPKTADKEKMIGQTIDENRQLINTQLDSVTKDIQSKSEQFRKEHPVLFALSNVSNGSISGVKNEYKSDARYANLSAASRLLDESEQLLNAPKSGGWDNVKGVIHGIKDAASNIDTYSMGLSDLLDNKSVFNALQKYQENKPLTEDEERLLDAVSINAAARLAVKDPNYGYYAGSSFVQSVPFMLEMMLNPISGAGKALTKYAVKRFAKSGANKLLKGSAKAAGRVAADAMAATGMAMTTGAAGVAADTYNRMSGVPVVDNQFGEIQLSDVKSGESAGKAFYKSLASRSIENFSEMFGEYFGPIGNVLSNTSIGKKLSSSAIINELNKLTYADWAKKYQDILKDGRFNGFIGETAEEYVGGLLNAALVGDQSFEDLASVENLVQTVSAVGLMSGVFGAVNLAGVRSARYQARKKLEKSEKEAYEAIGEDFNSLKEEMLNNDPDSRNAAMESIISSQDLSVKQKQSLINYLYYQNQYDGLLNGENKRVNETIETENNAIREESNQETGMYVEASLIDPLTGARIPGTIVKGSMDDANLYVTWRGEDGNVKMVKKSDIDPATIQSMPTQDVIDSNATMMQQAAEKEIDHDMSYDPSIPAPEENLGTSFVLPDGGTYRFISTTPEGGFIAEQLDNEGNVIATTDQITAEDYYNSMQRAIDAVEDANNMSENKAQNETSPSGEESKVSETGTEQVSFPMKGEEIDYSKITEPNVYAAALQQEFGNDAASVLDEIITDKQAELEKASKGKDAITRRRVTNKINTELSLLNEARNIITPVQTKEVIKQVNDNVTEPTPVAKETVPELATAEEVQTEQAPLIPVNEQGVPQYHLTSIDNTLDDLLDGSLSIEEVNSFVDENIKAAEKELKEVEKRKPKMGTSKADYLAQRDAIAEELNAVRQKVEYWNNVKKEITPEEQDSQVIDKWMNEEPMNLQELAAQMIATGRLKLLQADYKKQTGYGNKEARKMFGIFASKENGGVSLEKAGEIIELRAREEGLLSNEQEIEYNSGFEALMDVLTGSSTKGDINSYVANNRERILREEREYQDGLEAAMAEQAYGMSLEDYRSYVEAMERGMRQSLLSDEDYAELQGEIYDDMMAREREYYEEIDEALELDRLNNVKQQKNIEDYGENDEGRNDSLYKGSERVLPETQVNQERGVDNPQESEQAVADIGSENGVAQENTSGEIKPIGKGAFGDIYDQFKGKAKEAIKFLLKKRSGEAIGALHHKDVGDIDLVWGKEGTGKSNGFGLSKLAKFHPEVLDNLQEIIDDMVVISRTENRINLESETHKAAVRLEWDGEKKNWLLTAFEKEKPTATDRTTDIGDTELQNDTAPLQTADSSTSKGKKISSENQEKGLKINPNESLLDFAQRVVDADTRAKEEQKVEQNPTDAQKEAGNYKKGHIKVNGLDITIEQPKGSVRSGKDRDGKEWSVTMNNTYGYIRGTKGVDGDHIDVFLSDDTSQGNVYVVDQVNPDGSFDEHKVMYGFPDIESAKTAYMSNYEKGWKGLGNITEVSKDDFKKWIDSSVRKSKPFAEYKGFKQEAKEDSETDEERFRFIGEIGAGNLDKAEEATTRLDNLSVARQMEGEGKDTKNIKYATGWERGADGKWRYETEDFEIDVSGLARKNNLHERLPWGKELDALSNKLFDGEVLTEAEELRFDELVTLSNGLRKTYETTDVRYLDDYVKDSSLFVAYPKLREVQVEMYNNPNSLIRATWYRDNNIIRVNEASLETGNLRSILLHEVQHAIQNEEGFSRGGSPDVLYPFGSKNILSKIEEANRFIEKYGDNFLVKARKDVDNEFSNDAIFIIKKIGRNKKKMSALDGRFALMQLYMDKANIRPLGVEGYKKLSGEVEARNVERRLNMTLEDRKKSLASETEDVSREDQIFLEDAFADGSKSMSTLNEDASNDLQKINARFNTELQQQIDGTLPKGHIYQLGRPSASLLSSGIPDLQIELRADKLAQKASDEYKSKHPFSLSDVVNLPQAIANPLAVFDSNTGYGSKVILTELTDKKGNSFVVSMNTNVPRGYNRIQINSITSVYPKDNSKGIIGWINRGDRLRYADKNKFLNWIAQQLPHATDLSIRTQELNTATNIVENFRNPTAEQGKIIAEAQNIAESLNTDINIITDVRQIEDDNKGIASRKRNAKGWYDTKTETVHVVIPNHADIADVQATVLHEVVAHKGLRKMFGEDFDTFLDNVYANATEDIRRKIVDKTEGNPLRLREATEEYLAELAEKGFDNKAERTLWKKVKDAFLDLLRKAGIKLDFQLTDNELRYILWRSYKQLQNENLLDIAEDITKRTELGIGDPVLRFREEGQTDKKDAEDTTVQEYEAALNKKNRFNINTYKAREAFQDSMLSVKILQETLEKHSGKEVRNFEDVYKAENQLGSKTYADFDSFRKKYFEPLVKELDELIKEDWKRNEDLKMYVYAKSGLERNEKFPVIKAEQEYEDKKKELDKSLIEGKLNDKQYDALLEQAEAARDQKIADSKTEDFSGLTGLMKDYNEVNGTDEKDFKSLAEKIVSEYESQNDTKGLWKAIRAVNDFTLRKEMESGLISSEQFRSIKNMGMDYYVPLRGWKEEVASDVYEYVTQISPVENINAKMKGRKSLAFNPLATMCSLAGTAIVLGNRNKMKQKLYNLVVNRPSALATVRDIWYVKNAEGKWEPDYPDLGKANSAEAINKALGEHEERMRELEKDGKAKRKHPRLDIGLKANKSQLDEHTVKVKINGQEYAIYIKANPRAAQALNGMFTYEKNKMLGVLGFYTKLKRLYGASMTSYNPDFILPNFDRDTHQATALTFMNYGLKGVKNAIKESPDVIKAVYRGIRGKFDPKNEYDVLFKEFLENGGETGYVQYFSSKDFEKDLERILMPTMAQKAYDNSLKKLGYIIEQANRMSEDITRFNAYVRSRKAGKTIVDSIDDAKNISVNFGRRGAGFATGGFWGTLSGVLNEFKLFFNPVIQGINIILEPSAKHKARFAFTLFSHFALGMLVPYLYDLFGDDDYWNQSDFNRMNNLIIGRIKIPMAPFFREIYGTGDIVYRLLTDRISAEDSAWETVSQVARMFSLEGLSNPLMFFSPDLGSPVADIYENENFMGLPIAKQTDFNEFDPEYKRVYKGTNGVLVAASKYFNDITGGDDVDKSRFDNKYLNPAYIEHLLINYTGGIGKTLSNIIGSVVDLINNDTDNLSLRKIPVFGRFILDNDERTERSAINRQYYKITEEVEKMEHNERGYANKAASGDLDYLEKLASLQKSKKYQNLYIVNQSKKNVMRLMDIKKKVPETDKETLEKIDAQIMNIKADMVNRVRPK